MASGVTRISDIVVPEIFSPYTQQLTEQKSRLIRSGAVVVDSVLNQNLVGGGLTFNEPSFRDLDNDADRVSEDDPSVLATPNKIQTSTEIQVRLSRNNSWSSMDLSGDLAGADPMGAIANRVSDYWVRRHQAAFIATMTGIFAMNATSPTGGSTHTQDDMTHDVSGSVFADGVTNFSAEAFIDATATMGDSMDQLGMIMVHSLVYARMLKNNLIDFVQDSINGQAVSIPTFLGRTVIVDDGVPRALGVFESWLFSAGTVRAGLGAPKVPTETDRIAAAGNGAGQEVLHNRVEWVIHASGHAYVGTSPAGGPANGSGTNNLAAAASWIRVFPERKQIGIARLITREF